MGEEITRRVAGVNIVVDLNLVGTSEVTPGRWRAALERSYQVLGDVVGDWRRESRADHCWYVVATSQGGRFGTDPELISQPLTGLWARLAKTLVRELPVCNVRVVDMDEETDPGSAVVAEIVSGRFFEVGLSGGQRFVLLPRPRPLCADAPDHSVHLDPSTTVLFSGGGRGIGYHLAQQLRAAHGCRVIVTGRQSLDSYDDDLLRLDDDGFRGLSRERLRGCLGGEQIKTAREELSRIGRARELWRNLESARLAGAELEYRHCDITDSADVAALLASVEGPIAAVVHDAGIDLPTRVGRKTFAQVKTVVRVKVDGFLHLLDALADRPVGTVCAVGSLAGRFGGTAGQSDYAGANEALARLTDWAGATRAYPMTCVGWPTWDRVGLITNFDAATREVGAVPVDRAVLAWERELRTPRQGEVLFFGAPGEPLPAQLWGMPCASDAPWRHELSSLRHLLGRVVSWAPGDSLVTSHEFGQSDGPVGGGFAVSGQPAVPVSLAIELLLGAARWLQPIRPPKSPPLVPCEMRQLRIHIEALAIPAASPLRVRRQTRARWEGDSWLIDVSLVRDTRDHPTEIGQVTLICCPPRPQPAYGTPTPPIGIPEVTTDSEALALLPGGGAGVAWTAAAGLLRAGPIGADGWRNVHGERRTGSDLYHGALHFPEPTVPVGALEAMFWANCPPDTPTDSWMHIDVVTGDGSGIDRISHAGHCEAARMNDAADTAVLYAADGRVVLRLDGLRWSTSASATPSGAAPW
ncbi:SDR family NAD(P)-dependent oxidoreductase [Streptomyces mirabilis]